MRKVIIQKKRRGMTGLETAIILVAFVISAAAFSFIVLNMGFLTAQKSQSVVMTGMKDASSSLQADGEIIGRFEMNPNKTISNLPYMISCEFYFRISQGREPIDLSYNRTTVTFTNSRISDVITEAWITKENAFKWNGAYLEPVLGDNDTLIEYGERWKATINFKNSENMTNSIEVYSGAYEQIRIDIRPSTGSVLSVVRRIPPINSEIIILE